MDGTTNTGGLAITRTEDASGGRYAAYIQGSEAVMTYSRPDERTLVIHHTGVPFALRHRGIGQALVQRAVEDARAEGRTIVPVCSFVRVQMARHADWRDVLKR